MDQANGKRVLDPDSAISEYWDVSKVFYSLGQPQKTAEALKAVVELASKNCSQSAKLALARLMCLYNRDFGNLAAARGLVLEAVEEELGICHSEILEVAQQCNRVDMATLLSESQKLVIKHSAAKPIKDGSVGLVIEASSLFTQNQRPEEEAQTHDIGVVLCLLAVELSTSVKKKQEYLARLGEIFRIMGNAHRTLDARLLKAELGLDCGTDGYLKCLWDVAETLLFALEAEDYIRAKKIEQVYRLESYPDLEIIREISEAARLLDVDRLEKQCDRLDHVSLLVNMGNKDLLMNQVDISRDYQLNVLDRLRTIVLVCQAL
ncbi:hypothetical protein CLU79DRAFT_6825 [Phycomyces nitens]|nr:hypothetical protein CLU79DRAFT_6825 [Phycomyces nitens]